MVRVILERLQTGDEGTFGRIIIQGETFISGELPWQDNQSDISCIPVGTYECHWTFSYRFKKYTYSVLNVPNRSGIRIHSANFMGDRAKGYKCQINGCITLGEKLVRWDRQKALAQSTPAVRRFEFLLERKPFLLEVRDGIY